MLITAAWTQLISKGKNETFFHSCNIRQGVGLVTFDQTTDFASDLCRSPKFAATKKINKGNDDQERREMYEVFNQGLK